MRLNYHYVSRASLFQHIRHQFGCDWYSFESIFLISFAVEKVGDDDVDGIGWRQPEMKKEKTWISTYVIYQNVIGLVLPTVVIFGHSMTKLRHQGTQKLRNFVKRNFWLINSMTLDKSWYQMVFHIPYTKWVNNKVLESIKLTLMNRTSTSFE